MNWETLYERKAKRISRLLGLKRKPAQGKEAVYIGNLLSDSILTILFGRLVFAKGVADRQGLPIVLLTMDGSHHTPKPIIDAFGADSAWVCGKGFGPGRLEALFCTVLFYLKVRSGKQLLQYTSRGIHMGEYIYDCIIRKTEDCTVGRIGLGAYFKIVLGCHQLLTDARRHFRRVRPKYYLTWDRCYDEGITAELAANFGAKIIEIKENINEIQCDGKYTRYEHAYYRGIIEKQLEHVDMAESNAYMEQYFSDFFAGKADFAHGQNAVAADRIMDREEFVRTIGADPDKKNVVVASHCLSDWNHCGEEFIFRDYYSWLAYVLACAERIPGVNWIIKRHPSAPLYPGEKAAIDGLIKKYEKTPHIFVFPDHLNSKTLVNVADVLLTVGGTPGIEYGCFGIPVILAGKAWYSDFGTNLRPKGKKEYTMQLKRIAGVQRLNEEQISRNRAIFYLYKKMQMPSKDALSQLINRVHKLYWKVPVKNGTEINCIFMDGLSDYLKDHRITESFLYQRGNLLQ